ncbi:Hypothetical predicted protein [Octopus vulgaris]|uniref:Uncharacterized protein n=1 Tax=Octopus vulgaris TaxID=6645 RepID=A0AA36F9W6_OCTVU|nr:Hypothetical predicted protein [Octopus vulgaris]
MRGTKKVRPMLVDFDVLGTVTTEIKTWTEKSANIFDADAGEHRAEIHGDGFTDLFTVLEVIVSDKPDNRSDSLT